MANIYKNAFYDPSDTSQVSVYTVPSDSRAIIQNIQITNESGNKVVKAAVTDNSATTDYQIAYASISGPTICNIAKGPVALEENDILKIESSVAAGISAIISILEINTGTLAIPALLVVHVVVSKELLSSKISKSIVASDSGNHTSSNMYNCASIIFVSPAISSMF